MYAKDKKKLSIYKKMHQNEWRRIGEEGRKHYQTMRNIYKSQYDEIKRVLETRLKETVDPSKVKKTV